MGAYEKNTEKEVNDLLRKAIQCLKLEEFDNAYELCSRAIGLQPGCAEARVYRLAAKMHMKSVTEFTTCDDGDLFSDQDYIVAYSHAGIFLKNFLQTCKSEFRSRSEEKRKTEKAKKQKRVSYDAVEKARNKISENNKSIDNCIAAINDISTEKHELPRVNNLAVFLLCGWLIFLIATVCSIVITVYNPFFWPAILVLFLISHAFIVLHILYEIIIRKSFAILNLRMIDLKIANGAALPEINIKNSSKDDKIAYKVRFEYFLICFMIFILFSVALGIIYFCFNFKRKVRIERINRSLDAWSVRLEEKIYQLETENNDQWSLIKNFKGRQTFEMSKCV